ncbi:MAG: replicative DNA helicase [Actinomycetota bacterium]|nr:replicative DNA helicase [Actinomycetota bacterium]
MAANGTVPPQNLEAEASVLGSIMLTEQALDGLLLEVGLRPEHFYRPRHALIFRAMMRLKEKAEPEAVDALTVCDDLERTGELEEAGGTDYVHLLPSEVIAAGNVHHYARIVKQHAMRRRLLTTAREIQDQVFTHSGDAQTLVEKAEAALFKVGHEEGSGEMKSLEEVLDEEVDRLERLSREGIHFTGTPSGFRDLDDITGGFQPGNLIVVAARPAMGKSAFVTNIAENAAVDKGKAVALFSLEMAEAELAQRFLASQAKLNGKDLRRGHVKADRWPKVMQASDKLSKAPIYVDDSSDIGVLEIRAKARRLHSQNPLGLLIVDYLQLLRADPSADSRVEQVGQMSRGLKILARELSIPVIAVSQLSRAVESRNPPKPMLSDLRECVTGDTLVMLADGRRVPIDELVGSAPEVLAVDSADQVVATGSDKVWRVGRRPVLRMRLSSGRFLRGTARHRVRTGTGWARLGDLSAGDRVCLARTVPPPAGAIRWADDRVVLLGHLIGDGSYLTRQPLHYTTGCEESSRAVALAAQREFGSRVSRHEGGGNWHQLVIAGNGDRRHPAGLGLWLRELGIWDQRSTEKRVPAEAFRLSNGQIALLIRHLWATDGSIWSGRRPNGRRDRRVAFTTASRGLAGDVAALLLRLGIVARLVVTAQPSGKDLHHVVVSGTREQKRFLEMVGAFGERRPQALKLSTGLEAVAASTNVDTLPAVWTDVRAATQARGITTRAMAGLRGTAFGGAAHFNFAPSRAIIDSHATALGDPALARHSEDDLFWDRVVSVEPDGEEDVFDLTVPGPACWLADGVVSHNSGQIEQDADLVMFLYREEYYDDESERRGEADVIVSKHRNGPIGEVSLAFLKEHPKFNNLARSASGGPPPGSNGRG